jgi:ketosteroid isomerase-like protein
MIALAFLAAAAAHSPGAAVAEGQIRAQRTVFNRAIASGDLPTIAAMFTEDAQVITGSGSRVFCGRAAQVGLWWEDLQAPSRAIYVRTRARIELSPLYPIAMESGHWRGVDSKAATDWASGSYAAKWRRVDGKWLIESETYMTTACGGKFCPNAK